MAVGVAVAAVVKAAHHEPPPPPPPPPPNPIVPRPAPNAQRCYRHHHVLRRLLQQAEPWPRQTLSSLFEDASRQTLLEHWQIWLGQHLL